MQRLVRVINTRLEGIHQSLERMGASSSAKRTWELIETPLEIDFDKAVAWGKGRLETFRNLSLEGKGKIGHAKRSC